jgi:hypothetical protein
MKIEVNSRLFIFILTVGLIMCYAEHAEAQQARGKRSAKDKRMANYRGGAINFKKDRRYWTGSVHVSSANYFGDLAPNARLASTDFSATRIGAGISTTYRTWSNMSVGGSLNWNRLYADDYTETPPIDGSSAFYRYQRNLHFRNDIIELAGFGIIDAIHNRGTYFVRPQLVPYAFAGLAIFYHNPKAMAPEKDLNGNPLAEGGKWVALKPLGTEGQKNSEYKNRGYSLIQLAIPFGCGLRYKLTTYLDLEFELSYRFLFTDYIDDVSKDYVDLGALDSELARAMAFRSLEPTSATSGKERLPSGSNYSYTSKVNGQTYNVLTGYGHDNTKNIRGNSSNNDHYLITSLRIKYIIHEKPRKNRFR